MTKATLPSFLSPQSSSHLIRIGRENDGGYLVDRRDIEKSDLLVGLGIGDDCSFEQHFSSVKDLPVLAFDASVSESLFLKRILRSVRPKLLSRRLRTWWSYRAFFKGNKRHIQSMVGLDIPPEQLSMKGVFAMALDGAAESVYLKVDIEGSEYRLLEDLVRHVEYTSGLVIEFHDCDLHIERIRGFIDRYPLSLVHVHSNNFAPLDKHGLPLVMELTFSSSEPTDESSMIPHGLDMPNNANKMDYEIRFV